MSDEATLMETIAFWICVGFISFCLVMLGRSCTKDDIRMIQEEAVKTGHAEFYLDQNNERQWRWKQTL